ncbi:MAG: amino acid adenylation domain-containing protein, partial [bacterium]|nr:amino acid adenylation domain-containing protein [bacterium]
VLPRHAEKDPQKILHAVETAGVTHINFVPSMFQVFVDVIRTRDFSRLSGLKYIFLAGEALLAEPVRKFGFSETIRLENIYGPTEGTIYAARFPLRDWDGVGSIPIGKPLPNIQLYILDRLDRFQPVGIPGELCIGGEGVARGYLNRPELTAGKFIKKDFSHGLTLTKTDKNKEGDSPQSEQVTRRVTGGPGGASPWPSESRRRHCFYKSGD